MSASLALAIWREFPMSAGEVFVMSIGFGVIAGVEYFDNPKLTTQARCARVFGDFAETMIIEIFL